MTDILSDQQAGTAARSHTHALFAQTMGYVAVTAALFALGAWLGRNLTGDVDIVAFIAAFAALIAMRFAARRSAQLAVGLLAAFGLLIGLIVAGIVLIVVHIPGADLAYSVLGLIIFARFTMFDFQRLRTNTDITAAPLLAASIFLDVSTSSCSSCRSSPTRSGNSHGRVEPGFHRRADRHPAGPGHGVALPFIAARDTAQEFSSARQPDLTPHPWPTSSSRSVHVHRPVRPVRLNRMARTCS